MLAPHDHRVPCSAQLARQCTRYIAALAGHFELVHSCYLAGADVNRPNASGATPLIACCGRGHAKCAAVLRHAGADMAAEHRGHTAMEWALHHGHTEVLRVLAMRDPASIFDSGEAPPDERTPEEVARMRRTCALSFTRWCALPAARKGTNQCRWIWRIWYAKSPPASSGGRRGVNTPMPAAIITTFALACLSLP